MSQNATVSIIGFDAWFEAWFRAPSTVSTILDAVRKGRTWQPFLPTTREIQRVQLIPLYACDPEWAEGELEYFDPEFDPEVEELMRRRDMVEAHGGDPECVEGGLTLDLAEEMEEMAELGLTQEDIDEFRARNIERGTASTHWY